MSQTIAIIDYGMGNLFSVAKALASVGAATVVTRDPSQILQADKVVLPGVGAFGDCMRNLQRYQLTGVIQEVAKSGKPFLGICLGLQLLFERSEEDPEEPGLGILPGAVKRLAAPGLKVPHMGWNNLELSGISPLFADIGSDQYVYFVHSYHVVPADPSIITATVQYGESVTAAIGYKNVQAVQFHPEKSSQVGLAMLNKFKEMTP